jgi:fructose-bisphosphate aldolase class II
MHGMLKSMVAGKAKKRLDIERIKQIKEQTHIFMTLHGASGTDDEDLRKAIGAGITVVHINTEVRIAWRYRNGRRPVKPAKGNRPLQGPSACG